MSDFSYDGTFWGLLTVIDELLQAGQMPSLIRPDSTSPDLFYASNEIVTDEKRAQQFDERIRLNISENAHDHFTYAFLSERPERELALFHYIRLGFEHGADVDRYRSNTWVHQVHSLSRKVTRELHRMQGFLRFEQLSDGIFYAPMQPDFFILPLLAPFFCNRLRDQHWVIHDVRRKKAALYNQQDCTICDISINQPLARTEAEEEFLKLWRLYFDTIAIESRSNARLQQQLMPKKYWRYLVEKESLN